MFRSDVMVLTVLLLAIGPPSAGVRASAAPAPPSSPAATLAVAEVTHSLEGRTLVITGWVRNAGRLPVSRLVIDASGFAPTGDLAAFGSDGIPWAIRPDGTEHFRIFLPLGKALVSTYTVSVTGSRPRQDRPASVTHAIFPRFYRPLSLRACAWT